MFFYLKMGELNSYDPQKKYTGMEWFWRTGGEVLDLEVKDGVLWVPDTVEVLGWDAFWDPEGVIEEIHIPSSVTYIRHGAFVWCKGLKRLYLPKSIYKIGVHDQKCIDTSTPEYPGNFCEFNDHNITVYCEKGSIAEQYSKLFRLNISLVENME